MNQIQTAALMTKTSNVKGTTLIYKRPNIHLFSLSGIIIVILLISIGFYIYNPILGIIAFIISVLILSRYHYFVLFYYEELIVKNPMYIWKKDKEKIYKYSDIKHFKYNGITLHESPFAIITMKSGDIIKFSQIDIDSYMKKLIAVLENYDVPIEGIDMKKYGTKK